MQLVRDTPLELGYFVWQLRPPKPSLTLVVKATYTVVDGGAAKLARKQKHVSGELYWDEDEAQSARFDSDLAVLKKRGECFLVGTCHAPGGVEVTATACGFSVGPVKRTFAVQGDRYWNRGIFANTFSKPASFTAMPLRWERCFGGPDIAANPLGTGVVPTDRGDGPRVYLPNIEDPSALLTAPDARPAPHGGFPLLRSWAARHARTGTYDAKYLAERWPYFPEDFDFEYFNAAPEPQRIAGFWKGNEDLTLQHLNPKVPNARTRLPGHKPRVGLVVQRGGRVEFDEVKLELDTITVDGDAWEVQCLWRGLAEVSDEKLSDVLFVFVTVDGPNEQRTLPELRAAFERARRAAGAEDARYGLEPVPDEPEVSLDYDDDEEDDDGEAAAAEWNRDQEHEREQAAVAEHAEREAQKVEASLQNALRTLPEHDPPDAPATVEPKALEELARAAGLTVPPELLALLANPPPGDEPAEEPAEEPAGDGDPRAEVAARYARGESLAESDYTGADLSRLNLEGVDFSKAILANARFDGAALTGAKLDGAVLTGASFVGASLAKATLVKADLTAATLEGASLVAADLSGAVALGARCDRADFTEARAVGADFSAASAPDARFDRADFTEANLSRARLERASLEGAKLVDASLEGAQGPLAVFKRADLTRVRAGERAAFPQAQFQRTRGAGAIFTEARLERADFSFSDLPGADFAGAQLARATLNGCDLRRARFDDAQAQLALMLKSDAMEANFTGADLSLADLRGSSLFAAELYRAKTEQTQFDLTDLKRTKLEGRGGEKK